MTTNFKKLKIEKIKRKKMRIGRKKRRKRNRNTFDYFYIKIKMYLAGYPVSGTVIGRISGGRISCQISIRYNPSNKNTYFRRRTMKLLMIRQSGKS